MDACTHMLARTHARTRHTHTHARARTHTHTHVRARTTHSHTHSHTHKEPIRPVHSDLTFLSWSLAGGIQKEHFILHTKQPRYQATVPFLVSATCIHSDTIAVHYTTTTTTTSNNKTSRTATTPYSYRLRDTAPGVRS